MSSSPAPLAVVTGASGYVAGDVIAELLSRGFRVRGTVRNLADASKTHTLRDRFPALELFEADLLADGSFASAFAGADYVLHTASPVLLAAENPQRDLIDPAVDGTENVIRAALATPTVSRIVLTSSVVAIMSASPPPAGTVFTEADWNADATLDNQPYYLSKRLAEQAAWQLVRDYQHSHPERAIGLAVINPSLVFGPPASGRVEGLSVSLFKGIINGQFKDGAPPMNFTCVDVRDVARAHVEALLRPEAAGHRFIVSQEEPASFVEIADLLRAAGGRLAELPLPTTLLAPITYHARFSNEKTRTILGIEPTPLARTVVDLANYLLDNNQVNQ